MPEALRPELLEALARLQETVRPRALEEDPVRFPRRYARAEDREAAALLAALFAYGNVKAMGAFLESLFVLLGPRPALALRRGRFAGAPAYRFQSSEDVAAFLSGTGQLLRRYGSLEAAFQAGLGSPDERLETFARLLRREARRVSPGLRHLLPLPSGGSACKRWRLFLRWVVRSDDGVDLGLWKTLRPSDLVVPLDTHLTRLARALGLSRRCTAGGDMAREVTEALRRLDPEDPCRFDFVLAHAGIQKRCRGTFDGSACPACPLRPHCPEGAKGGPRFRPRRRSREKPGSSL